MDQAAADVAIKACLRKIRDRAAQVGAASDVALLCADKCTLLRPLKSASVSNSRFMRPHACSMPQAC
jgi:hypothetical protein